MLTLADMLSRLAALLATVLTGVDTIRKLKSEKNERLATFLESISFCLIDLAKDIRERQDAHRCWELHIYVLNLEGVLKQSSLIKPAIQQIIVLLDRANMGPYTALRLVQDRLSSIVLDLSSHQALADAANSCRPGPVDWSGDPGEKAEKGRLLEAELRKLEEAAAVFKGLAVTLRAL